ncbi:MAG: peptidase M14 [Pyrinomonadaceae bacterium]|nr:peptidase M14 [Pyrinomonadaceae bacterium]
MKRVILLAVVLSFTSIGLAQKNFEFWPGTSYDPAVPTFKQVLGFEPGERIASHAQIMKYFEALERAYPNRVKVYEYARTWEGRKLVYVAVGSESNISRLDSISDGMKRLADPRVTNKSQADRIMSTMPAITWLAYGVHGNEISSPDAAMLTAYHLIAARGSSVVDTILADGLVMIDPTQNPDGRDRFVHNFNIAEGLEPDESQIAAEHNEPWPGGRTNHYYFDMNRDWIALTQPETRGRIKALQEWFPVVFVDLHEMNTNSTYYFAPEAVPYNPHLAKDQRASLDIFGKNNSKWFDQFGFDYFTREVYDAFYPGYGASWPSYFGSVAMTYEQASVRGLVVRKSDGTRMHFRDSVRHHFVASVSTAEAAARNRTKLLNDFYNYRLSAISEGSSESIKSYVIPRRGNTSAVDKLAHLLSQQGIEVRQSSSTLRACSNSYPAGTYAISLAQPAKRLIRTLLDRDVPMEEEFLKEQERRRSKGLSDEIYDVTAWSLPLMYGVDAIECGEALGGNLPVVKPEMIPPGRVVGGNATVAYLVPSGTTAAARMLTASLRKGLTVFSSDKEFVQNGKTYPRGTLILKRNDNPDDLATTVAELARETGAEVHATNTGWVDSGVNFGSRNVVRIKPLKIALAWDTPTSSYSAGQTRFILERQFGYPVTPIRARQLAFGDLSKFDVILLPNSFGYAGVFGPAGSKRIKDWVSAGGTLIGLGSGAVSYLADPRTGMLAVARENAATVGKDGKAVAPKKPAKPAPRVPGSLIKTEEDYKKSISADASSPDSVSGVLLRAKLDQDHWITVGAGESVNAIVRGNSIFTPIKMNRGVNAAYFSGPDDVLASGYLWEENRKQLAFKPFVIVQRTGRGHVIGFTADPTIRAYIEGLHVLLVNSIFQGAAHAR